MEETNEEKKLFSNEAECETAVMYYEACQRDNIFGLLFFVVASDAAGIEKKMREQAWFIAQKGLHFINLIVRL